MKLAISPCPNDTYAFFAWLQGLVPGPQVDVVFEDIETLNNLCFRQEADVCKVSFHAYINATRDYIMLPVGAALGFGCGPLVVINKKNVNRPITDMRIASPGRWTTAQLLLQLWAGQALNIVHMPFDRIVQSVASGDVDAGLIIHESRFTYQSDGLQALVDLGVWWESQTQMPIPLGGIAVRRKMEKAQIARLVQCLKMSLVYADAHPDECIAFMQKHAQEMDPEVMAQHVKLYVNQFTHELGDLGHRSILKLAEAAFQAGLITQNVDDELVASV